MRQRMFSTFVFVILFGLDAPFCNNIFQIANNRRIHAAVRKFGMQRVRAQYIPGLQTSTLPWATRGVFIARTVLRCIGGSTDSTVLMRKTVSGYPSKKNLRLIIAVCHGRAFSRVGSLVAGRTGSQGDPTRLEP